jgi:biopolymer transport protein ExbD
MYSGGPVIVFTHRARRRRAEEGPEVVLPITPMLDMAFQLLFFFIAIYRPPTIREVQMELSLLPMERPPAESPETKAAEPGQPVDPNPRIALKPYDLTLMLETRIEKTGEQTDTVIEKYIVKGIPTALRAGLGVADPEREEVEAPDLPTLAGYLKKAHPPPDTVLRERIKLEMPATGGDLDWGRVVEVLDACHRGGFTYVALP